MRKKSLVIILKRSKRGLGAQVELAREDRQVFHALRKTFVEVLEVAEVPESTTKLLIGHARASLTYGLYSKGQRVQLRDAINKLHYASGVMKLIRGTKDDKQAPGKRKDAKGRRLSQRT